jgi:hypothetical protein
MGESNRRRAVIASLVAALFLSIPAAAMAGGEIKEPDSGIGFPVERSWGSYRMTCVGTGLRRKYGFKVYAACFYIDHKLGKQKLLEFLSSKGREAYAGGKLDVDKLLSNRDFFNWLVSADLPVSVDMTFLRSAPAEKIRETYKEGLSLYLKDDGLLSKFVAQFEGELQKFQHLTLNVMPGGRVTLQIANKTNPPLVSKPLARALLSIYFGAKPISDAIKHGLVRHIDTLLR